jgi:integrase
MGRPAGTTIRLDMRIKGLPRLAKATGTNDPKVVEGMREMIRQWSARKRDNIRAIIEGKTTLLECFEVWQNGEENKIDLSDTGRPFTSVFEWLKTYDGIGEKTRYEYESDFKQLEKLARKGTTVDELPDLLKRYKDKCLKAKSARQFNKVRNTCRSFLKNTTGEDTPTYRAIKAIEPMKGQVKRPDTALTVEDIEAITTKVDVGTANMIWSMCTSGIELGVYLDRRYEVKADRLLIHSDKMTRVDRRRDRVVPLIYPVTTPTIMKKTFRLRVKKANADVQLKDFRHCYSLWLFEAGIPEARIEQYMGHSERTMTRRYARTEVTKFLVEDAEKARLYIDDHRKTKPPTKRKAIKDLIDIERRKEEYRQAYGQEPPPDIFTFGEPGGPIGPHDVESEQWQINEALDEIIDRRQAWRRAERQAGRNPNGRTPE